MAEFARFHLRGVGSRATDLTMILRALVALVALTLLPSCDKQGEVVEVTETRRPTLRDFKPKLHATSDQRFRNTSSSPVMANAPAGWEALPATEFRLLNYRFGDKGEGEVWVSQASGGLLDNINRWLGQFGAAAIDPAGLAALPRVQVGELGQGVWIEAEGDYSPGMGRPARTGQALAGIILEAGNQLLTIKMVGPLPDVQAQTDALKSFAASFRLRQ